MTCVDGIQPVDQFLPAGTKVRLDACVNGDDVLTSEFGVVVHCWMNAEIAAYDCYVAFFGNSFPIEVPDEKPYILRYASTSLTPLSPE